MKDIKMKRWEIINRELKEALDGKDFQEAVDPFREEIKKQIEGAEKKGVKFAYRELRAQYLENTRISLALLDAAAHEENLVEK